MVDPVFMTPVSEEDPCGPDFRWDPAFLQLSQALDAALAREDESVIDAKTTSPDVGNFEGIVEMARALSTRTKDLHVIAIYAEACWRNGGLSAFAGAMEDLVSVAETWPGHNDGVHPRADEDDGDLGERAAPLGRLINKIPSLTNTIGWGAQLEISERIEVATTLRGVFEAWSHRLEPAFDRDLPPCREAWNALLKIIGDTSESPLEDGAPRHGGGGGGGGLPGSDAWDMVERAAELMTQQDHHSPALPVLRLLSNWRSLGIMEIAEEMRPSGVSLEQLLDSVRKQIEPKT